MASLGLRKALDKIVHGSFFEIPKALLIHTSSSLKNCIKMRLGWGKFDGPFSIQREAKQGYILAFVAGAARCPCVGGEQGGEVLEKVGGTSSKPCINHLLAIYTMFMTRSSGCLPTGPLKNECPKWPNAKCGPPKLRHL